MRVSLSLVESSCRSSTASWPCKSSNFSSYSSSISRSLILSTALPFSLGKTSNLVIKRAFFGNIWLLEGIKPSMRRDKQRDGSYTHRRHGVKKLFVRRVVGWMLMDGFVGWRFLKDFARFLYWITVIQRLFQTTPKRAPQTRKGSPAANDDERLTNTNRSNFACYHHDYCKRCS